jgi:hypothetical protein
MANPDDKREAAAEPDADASADKATAAPAANTDADDADPDADLDDDGDGQEAEPAHEHWQFNQGSQAVQTTQIDDLADYYRAQGLFALDGSLGDVDVAELARVTHRKLYTTLTLIDDDAKLADAKGNPRFAGSSPTLPSLTATDDGALLDMWFTLWRGRKIARKQVLIDRDYQITQRD